MTLEIKVLIFIIFCITLIIILSIQERKYKKKIQKEKEEMEKQAPRLPLALVLEKKEDGLVCKTYKPAWQGENVHVPARIITIFAYADNEVLSKIVAGDSVYLLPYDWEMSDTYKEAHTRLLTKAVINKITEREFWGKTVEVIT